MLAEAKTPRGGFGETFAEACVSCLQAIPEARRIDDVEDIRAIAIRLAGYARRAKNSEAAAMRRDPRAGRTENSAVARATRDPDTNGMGAPALAGDVRGRKGGLARAAKLTSERRAEIARAAAAARWA